jgi:hypothetical protein
LPGNQHDFDFEFLGLLALEDPVRPEVPQAIAECRAAGIRVVLERFGIILSAAGGALQKMLTPFKLGVGGVIGSGKQYMSWIDLDDVVAGFPLDQHPLAGPYHVIPPGSRFDATPPSVHRQASTIGQDGDEVLSEVGYTPTELAALRESGALRSR